MMHPVSNADMAQQFLGWQCRIRQIAMRQGGGKPSSGMRPRVFDRKGNLILDGMTVLIVPGDPDHTTRFFQFQLKKSADPKQAYEAVMKTLQESYFQKPKTFSDLLAAQFAPGSGVAADLAGRGKCLLEFDQFAQNWKLVCEAVELESNDPVRAHVLAHNRVFNRNIPNDAVVLGFRPDWASANADPPLLG